MLMHEPGDLPMFKDDGISSILLMAKTGCFIV